MSEFYPGHRELVSDYQEGGERSELSASISLSLFCTKRLRAGVWWYLIPYLVNHLLSIFFNNARLWRSSRIQKSTTTGCLGSLEFIRSFLVPDILENTLNSIQGAIILDSISNWDDQPNSQNIPQQWFDTLPEIVLNDIQDNGNKGAVTRSYWHSNECQFLIKI